MSFGIILATHAHIGEALLEGAEMLAGKQTRVRALSLTENKSAEEFEAEFSEVYSEFDEAYDHVVALCDIYGGTPFNVISRAMLRGADMVAYTGVNLPVLIDLVFSCDLTPDEVREHVLATNAEALQEVKVQLATEEDEDDLDL